MIDIATLTALATTAVAILSPLLQKAVEKGAEEVGKSAVGALVDKIKTRLTHAGAKEALDDLAKQPGDPAAQGALNMQLRKAIEADPTLATFLKQWVDESESQAGTSQTANVHGNDNKTIQISGSGNTVG